MRIDEYRFFSFSLYVNSNKIKLYPLYVYDIATMAQTDNIRRENSTSQRVPNSLHFKRSKDQTSPTFQQLLQRDGSKWSRIPLQKQKKNHGEEDNGNSNNMKSVLAKVKEKAKKLKISLSRKKSHNENESQSPSTARACGIGPQDKREDDAEYTRVNGLKTKPETNKQAPGSIPEKHSTISNTDLSKYEPASSSKTIKEEQTKNQAPSETSVATNSDTKNKAVATTKVSTPETSTSKSDSVVEKKETMKGESKTRDKGVSVKEYLMHKFEPGEDERALSKVITQTISPRRDKVREAMSSFLKNEEPSPVKKPDVDKNENLNFKSKSMPLPTSTNLNTNTGSKIAYIKPSYSLGSSTSKASLDLNETFKSTFATYQNHFLGSSSKANMSLNSSTTLSSPNTTPRLNQSSTYLHSPTKTSKSPLDHASSANANETQTPAQDPVSSTDQTRAPRHAATSVRRVHVSSANRTRVPSRTGSTANQTRVTAQTNANETRSPISSGNQG